MRSKIKRALQMVVSTGATIFFLLVVWFMLSCIPAAGKNANFAIFWAVSSMIIFAFSVTMGVRDFWKWFQDKVATWRARRAINRRPPWLPGPKHRKKHRRTEAPGAPGLQEAVVRIVRRKPRAARETPVKVLVLQHAGGEDDEKRRAALRRKWAGLIERLEAGEEVYVSCQAHHGSARGIDVLHDAKSDLRRLGYNCQIKKGDRDGYIWLE